MYTFKALDIAGLYQSVSSLVSTSKDTEEIVTLYHMFHLLEEFKVCKGSSVHVWRFQGEAEHMK